MFRFTITKLSEVTGRSGEIYRLSSTAGNVYIAPLGRTNNDLAKACKLLSAETIDGKDFKAECEGKITRLEAKISVLSQEFTSLELKQLLEKATASISKLDVLYHDADAYFKRQIICAIYPQKVEYDGYQFRTTHLNEVIATTFSLDAAFRKENSGQNGHFSILSAKEVPSRFVPDL